MSQCPHCGATLNRPTTRRTVRNDDTGRRDAGVELVSCPDCERVIDGFSAH